MAYSQLYHRMFFLQYLIDLIQFCFFTFLYFQLVVLAGMRTKQQTSACQKSQGSEVEIEDDQCNRCDYG